MKNQQGRTCALADHPPCEPPISGEHFLSKAVLKQITSTNSVSVAGLPWTPDKLTRVGIASLTSNILCKGHNSRLSRLDDTAAQLFSAMHQSYGIVDGLITNSESFRFNGYDVERWLLKVCFGLYASRSIELPASQTGYMPPPLWGDILLGKQNFPDGWGLFVRSSQGYKHVETNSIAISVVAHRSGGISGVLFELAGVQLGLALSDEFYTSIGGQHRPNSINMGRPPIAHRIGLTWIGNAFNPSVDMTLLSKEEITAIIGEK